ncbi:hypothetical protein [Neptunicella sp. SCSIO 80796]|uniref:hypothetical protein n=1 Tax=Neptunicella plasticusilytica TaxID=3117012 RepID=UPI003A4E4D12
MAKDSRRSNNKLINILTVICLVVFGVYAGLFLYKFHDFTLSSAQKDWADFATAFSAPLALLSVLLIIRSIYESKQQSLRASEQQWHEALTPLLLGTLDRLHSRYRRILETRILLGSGEECTFEQLFYHHDKDAFAKKLLLESSKEKDFKIQPCKKELNDFILNLKSTLELFDKHHITASLYWLDLQPMLKFLDTVYEKSPSTINWLALHSLSDVRVATSVRFLKELNDTQTNLN